MRLSANKINTWLLGCLFTLLSQGAYGQTIAPKQTVEAQPAEADTLPAEEAPPDIPTLEAPEESPEEMPQVWEQPWDLASLPDGMHLVSNSPDPNDEEGLFVFFEKQASQVVGYRYYPDQGALSCFQGQVMAEDPSVAEDQLTAALSAAYVDSEGWYFHTSDVVLEQFAYHLQELPADQSDETVAEEIAICRQVLGGIEAVPQGQLLLGVFSYLPLDEERTLTDGSYYNFHEFQGQAGAADRDFNDQ